MSRELDSDDSGVFFRLASAGLHEVRLKADTTY
jgi:hypothetical protein